MRMRWGILWELGGWGETDMIKIIVYMYGNF